MGKESHININTLPDIGGGLEERGETQGELGRLRSKEFSMLQLNSPCLFGKFILLTGVWDALPDPAVFS